MLECTKQMERPEPQHPKELRAEKPDARQGEQHRTARAITKTQRIDDTHRRTTEPNIAAFRLQILGKIAPATTNTISG